MPDLILVSAAQWEIRRPGRISLIGTEHIDVGLALGNSYPFQVLYRDKLVCQATSLKAAKESAMELPALLLDFGLDP